MLLRSWVNIFIGHGREDLTINNYELNNAEIFGIRFGICGKITIRIVTIRSMIRYGTTPLKISFEGIPVAFDTVNTPIPIGGVIEAMELMRQSTMISA